MLRLAEKANEKAQVAKVTIRSRLTMALLRMAFRVDSDFATAWCVGVAQGAMLLAQLERQMCEQETEQHEPHGEVTWN